VVFGGFVGASTAPGVRASATRAYVALTVKAKPRADAAAPAAQPPPQQQQKKVSGRGGRRAQVTASSGSAGGGGTLEL